MAKAKGTKAAAGMSTLVAGLIGVDVPAGSVDVVFFQEGGEPSNERHRFGPYLRVRDVVSENRSQRALIGTHTRGETLLALSSGVDGWTLQIQPVRGLWSFEIVPSEQ